VIGMIIKKIYIYGYGKWEQVAWDLHSHFQLFYGKNEAGKSTLMSFIHSILFGFPTKQQNDLRYEPKTSQRYGGMLIVHTETHGEVRIERVDGKATGNVTVWTEDGRTGGEDLLQDILKGVDKTFFQSIFSFNLDGIQGVAKVDRDQLGNYLLAAGTTGTDRLLVVQQHIQKQMEQLFKPQGRKPLLNQQLLRLKEKEKEVKEGKKKNASYESRVTEKQSLEQCLVEEKRKKDHLQSKLQKAEKVVQYLPMIKEKFSLEKKLESLKAFKFPIDGMNRMNELLEKKTKMMAFLESIKVREQELEAQLKTYVPNQVLIKHRREAEELVEEWSSTKQQMEKIREETRELEYLEEERLRLEQQLPLSFEQLTTSSQYTNRVSKEELKQFIRQRYVLEEQKNELDDTFQRETNELERMERECEQLRKSLLSDEQFELLKKRANDTMQLEVEEQKAQQQLQWLEQTKQQIQQSLVRNGFFGLFLFGLAGYFAVSSQWIGTLLSIVGAVVVGFFVLQHMTQLRKVEVERKELRKMVRFRDQQESTKDEVSLFQQLQEEEKRRAEWNLYRQRLLEQQRRYDDVIQQFEKWEQQWMLNKTKLQEIISILQLPSDTDWRRLEEIVRLLEQWSITQHRIKRLQQRIEEAQQCVDTFVEKLKDLLARLEQPYRSIEENIVYLKECLKQEEEKQFYYREYSIKLEELKDEKVHTEKELQLIQHEIDGLLKQASARDDEEFRQHHQLFLQKTEWEDKLSLLQKQLDHPYILDWYEDLVEQQGIHDVNEYVKTLEQDITAQEKRIQTLQENLIQCTYAIERLEEGGTYTDILHEFYELRSDFQLKAKEWARLAIAQHILTETMERLKRERLPKVVEQANEIFTLLTNGQYERIFLNEQGQLRVERNDKLIFSPNELSQGTSEQLYVALRFALVLHVSQDMRFPIIIDDSFVNFDEERFLNVVHLLKKMSGHTQILYFTCHEYVRNMFKEMEIVSLPAAPMQVTN
jgi:uncharacterized protein YhaN